MNQTEGKLELIGEGDKSAYGPWRRYAIGEQTFFAYPSEWKELANHENQYVQVDIKQGDADRNGRVAWQYEPGSIKPKAEPNKDDLDKAKLARREHKIKRFTQCTLDAVETARRCEGSVAFGPSEIQKIATTFYSARWKK